MSHSESELRLCEQRGSWGFSAASQTKHRNHTLLGHLIHKPSPSPPSSSFSPPPLLRFINARRRIVQPMIDQSNRAGKFDSFYIYSTYAAKVHFTWKVVPSSCPGFGADMSNFSRCWNHFGYLVRRIVTTMDIWICSGICFYSSRSFCSPLSWNISCSRTNSKNYKSVNQENVASLFVIRIYGVIAPVKL